MSAISIAEVTLVVDDDYKVTVRKYPEHFLLEQLKAIRIESERMSELPFYDDCVFDKKLRLFILCSNGRVLTADLKRRQRGRRLKSSLIKKRYKTIENKTIDGVLIPKNIKYIVYIFDSDGKKVVNYIDKCGLIKESIAGYNAIDSISMENINNVTEIIENILGPKYRV